MCSMADLQTIGVIGASSLVGRCLLSLLKDQPFKVIAYSRGVNSSVADGIEWRHIDSLGVESEAAIEFWICVAPISALSAYLDLLKARGAKRVVALSSTSRFSKDRSSDSEERVFARQLIEAEQHLQCWAEAADVDWVVLRPTLIYGLGRDKNISEIARLIRKFKFFPLLGKAQGLRQPIHAMDVAKACLSVLMTPKAWNKSYNISGGETLFYRDMVARVFAALQLKPWFLRLPMPLLRAGFVLLCLLPRYRDWSVAMIERMNWDLAFDHLEASNDFGFSPRPFLLASDDLPDK